MKNDFYKIDLTNDEFVLLNRANIVAVHKHNKAQLKTLSVITTDPECTVSVSTEQQSNFLTWLDGRLA